MPLIDTLNSPPAACQAYIVSNNYHYLILLYKEPVDYQRLLFQLLLVASLMT